MNHSLQARHRMEEAILELASRQHGVVTRAQLLGIGVTSDGVKHRARTGRLRRIHRGVYLVGPLETALSKKMAGVLVCGPGAVISHRSAAVLRGMLRGSGDSAPVDVTSLRRSRGTRRGLRIHRASSLAPDEVAEIERIPVTSPARTVLDLAGVVNARELERAVARAERQGIVERSDLSSLIARHSGRRGISRLRALVDTGSGPAFTRSEGEERFLALVRKARLPEPGVNVLVRGFEVDFVWHPQRLVVEVDGFAFHASQRTFESDRLRDAELSAAGYQVIRVTWRQIVDGPEAMLVRVAQALIRTRVR
jgi:very-short-patch-repair endonuclease/predicted transcriptional regulator of viral defense system